MNYIIKQIKLFLFLILFPSSLFASDIYDADGVDVAAVLLNGGSARNCEGEAKQGWCDYRKKK